MPPSERLFALRLFSELFALAEAHGAVNDRTAALAVLERLRALRPESPRVLRALRDALNSGNTSAVTAAQSGLTTGENLLVSSIANVGGVITCTLGDLASNATATVVLVLTNSAPGFMTNAVSLSSASTDPVSAKTSISKLASIPSRKKDG